MPKTKLFCVAVEGDTVDGRTIERSWLTDIAATYNRATYAARVNMEHIRGITADKPFKAYGDVLSVETRNVELELGGKKQTKLGLFAEIEPTDDLVAINRDKQKLYTSIEVSPNFANTGKAYLVGLAATDSPASLGTEALTFAVQHPGAIRNAPQKQHPDNVFSIGFETRFELDDAAPAAMSEEAKGFFSAATAFFKNLTSTTTPPVETPPAPTPPANDNDPRFTAIASGMEQMSKGIEAVAASFTKTLGEIRGEVATVKASIENTDGNPQRRAPATGQTAAQFRTDC